MPANQLGKFIRSRVEAKRKSHAALNHISWLFLIIAGIISLTLLRAAFMFGPVHLQAPPALVIALPLHGALWILLALGRVRIRQSELKPAFRAVRAAAFLMAALIFLWAAGWVQGSTGLLTLHRVSRAAISVFMIFFVANCIYSAVRLFTIAKKVKEAEIHSMSMSLFSKHFAYQTFLLMINLFFILRIVW